MQTMVCDIMETPCGLDDSGIFLAG
jgi:hypothetical protein